MRHSRRIEAWIWIAIALVFACAFALFVYMSKSFERNAPVCVLPQTVYWNIGEPYKIKISDDVGVKSVSVYIVAGGKTMPLASQTLSSPPQSVQLAVSYPKNQSSLAGQDAQLVVEASDSSWWGWFKGNKTVVSSKLVVDTKAPGISVVTSSYAISKGGSALVIFEAKDDNLDIVFAKEKGGRIFQAEPFYKNGFYAALVAWPIERDDFELQLMASDKAGNIGFTSVKFYIKNVVYKESKIELKDNFLDSKIVELAANMPKAAAAQPLDKFIYVNSVLRGKNEKNIEKITQKVGSVVRDSYHTEPFLPISRALVVGTFGDHRSFYYSGQKVSESYHLGIDFASVKQADIAAPNDATVAFADDNGIYGSMLVLDHGLGMFTLYGHCSSLLVKKADIVKKGQIVAKTGTSGLALGDHLHYGTVVQGVEVRPVEWLDAHWMKVSITQVMQDAKTVINGRK